MYSDLEYEQFVIQKVNPTDQASEQFPSASAAVKMLAKCNKVMAFFLPKLEVFFLAATTNSVLLKRTWKARVEYAPSVRRPPHKDLAGSDARVMHQPWKLCRAGRGRERNIMSLLYAVNEDYRRQTAWQSSSLRLRFAAVGNFAVKSAR